MDPRVHDILSELRQQLAALYASRLRALFLFGSQARGDNRPDSDIDVLVVLAGPVDPGLEIARTGAIVADLSLKHDVVISRKFVDEETFRLHDEPLVQNVRREGIAV